MNATDWLKWLFRHTKAEVGLRHAQDREIWTRDGKDVDAFIECYKHDISFFTATRHGEEVPALWGKCDKPPSAIIKRGDRTYPCWVLKTPAHNSDMPNLMPLPGVDDCEVVEFNDNEYALEDLGHITPDRKALDIFIDTLFAAATEGYVSLRVFPHKEGKPLLYNVSASVQGGDLSELKERAFNVAEWAANYKTPGVFCPPVASFKPPEKGVTRTRNEDLVEGYVCSIECDERASEALTTLRNVVGQPTLVHASGGMWNGEHKLHVHYRLSEPTRTEEEHKRLRHLRAILCDLVGADATNKAVVHPIRWPSIHRKGEAKQTKILEINEHAEIDLDATIDEIEGLSIVQEVLKKAGKSGATPETDDASLLRQCAAVIPNDDADWERWNHFLMAFWRASGGSDEGMKAAEAWSKKAAKHDDDLFIARWNHYSSSPPSKLGVGTLVYAAQQVDPLFGVSEEVLKAADDLELPEEPPAATDSDELNAHLSDDRLNTLFEMKRADFEGNLARYDMAIGNWAHSRGWAPIEAWRLIIAFRERGQHRPARRPYIATTLAKVYHGGLPEPVRVLIAEDERLANLWHTGAKISKNGSTKPASLDFQLANYLANRIDDDDAIRTAFTAFEYGNTQKLEGDKREGWLDRLMQVVGEARERAAKRSVPWRAEMIKDDYGGIAKNVANVATILRKDPAFVGNIRYDELKEAPVARRLPWRRSEDWVELEDSDDIFLSEWCQIAGVNVVSKTCHEALNIVALADRVNPVAEYLNSLEWDGKPRIDDWLLTYLGADVGDKDEVTDRAFYLRAIARRWLIAAVARGLGPGCKVDNVLIIEGWQGLKKSSAIDVLVPDPSWFADQVAELGTKDAAQGLKGKWIIEMSELAGMRRGEIERVKGFLSRKSDYFRVSFGKRPKDFPRRCIFAGTTNDSEFLLDSTGNRRFWIVKAQQVDVEGLKSVRDQLWAEATHAYKQGEKWWLDSADLEAIAHDVAREKVVTDPWEDDVIAWAERRMEDKSGDSLVTIPGFLDSIDMSKERQDQRAMTRVSHILTKNGWEKVKKRLKDNKRVRAWLPPDEPVALGVRGQPAGMPKPGPEKTVSSEDVTVGGPGGPGGPGLNSSIHIKRNGDDDSDNRNTTGILNRNDACDSAYTSRGKTAQDAAPPDHPEKTTLSAKGLGRSGSGESRAKSQSDPDHPPKHDDWVEIHDDD